MDAAHVRRPGPLLGRFLAHFGDCFSRRPTRERRAACVRGLPPDLPRKSAGPSALGQGIPARTPQEALGAHRWDGDRLRDRLQRLVARGHPREHSVGLIDGWACPR